MAGRMDRHTDGSIAQDGQSSLRRRLRIFAPDDAYDPDDRLEIVSGVQPYAVYSMYGRVLGRFASRHDAVAAMGHWPQGDYVIFAGSEIVARKDGTDDFGDRKAVAA